VVIRNHHYNIYKYFIKIKETLIEEVAVVVWWWPVVAAVVVDGDAVCHMP
jgi:hypothetical protein